jgi:D-alanyl-lipoteichoic acid acyltransferase DltB (MBOAT superfamily)
MTPSTDASTVRARSHLRHPVAWLGIALLASLAIASRLERIDQSQAYHDFADQRVLLGMPNVLDVASNLAFLIVGAYGIALCLGERRPRAVASWTTLFIGTALVSLGSAYYHWAPSDATLVWDRLPMTLGFMALFVALLAEHVGERLERALLAPALVAGVASVVWWRWTGDLRFYLWVQFAPLLCIPLVLLLFSERYSHRRYLAYGLGLYVLAKLAEFTDRGVFELTGHVVSGHTLKHLLAAGAIFCVLLMLRRRTPVAAP